MRKASKLEVLEFINKRGVISPFDLMERFKYTRGCAAAMLSWLKREKLVINDRRGEWIITNDGLRRLIYYRRL